MSHREVSPTELTLPVLAYDAVVSRVIDACGALEARPVLLRDALGLKLAEDVIADIDFPPFANSAMDGYAIDAVETAEATLDSPAPVGSAVKIMTGRPLPENCNAIVPWEDAVVREDVICVGAPVSAGAFVRAAGEDVRSGSVLVGAGVLLEPVHLATIAANGRSEVLVVPRPRVGVLITGDELVAPGRALPKDTIYDANGTLLPLLLGRLDADVVHIGHAGDDRAVISDWLLVVSADVDCIVTTGGASVGEHDWMRTILEEEGELDLWRVAMRPGKPFMFGHVSGVPVFGLPGNPASVVACTHAFVAPAIKKMLGRSPAADSVEAELSADVAAPGERLFLCPVKLDGPLAIPGKAASSGTVSNHFECDGFALIPAGGRSKGATVSVELFE